MKFTHSNRSIFVIPISSKIIGDFFKTCQGFKVWYLKKPAFVVQWDARPTGGSVGCASADSRRAVVSFWQKNVHNTG